MNRKKIIKNTELMFFSDKSTEWRVYRASGGYLSEFAERELKEFFLKCSGAKLKTAEKNARKLIWLGTAKDAETLKIKLPEMSGSSDFAIKTAGENCYIVGRSEYGLLYGVYEFLNVYFDFEAIAPDETYYKKVAAAKWKELDITDGPDVEWRIVNYGMAAKPDRRSAAYEPYRRLRLNHFDDVLMKPGGYFCHNYCVVIKPEVYESEHPEWFSVGKFAGQQLCFSRDFDGLKNEVIKKMKEIISAHPDVETFNFSQTDSAGWCECEECLHSREKYGTDAAVAIKFLNACAREIKKWLNAECGGRKVIFSMFAYQSTEEAPVKTVNGKYVPIDDSVVMDDNVMIFYAPASADYYRDMYDPANRQYKELMAKWKVLSRNVHFWTYDLWGKSYLFPHYTFSIRQNNYKFVKESDVSLYFNQGQYTQNVPVDFGRLKMYLDAKMSWDTTLDMDALVNNFLKKYYSDGAPAMREYYENYCAWHEYLKRNTELKGECFSHESFYASFYPEVVVDGWLKNLAAAKESVYKYKESDPDLFEKLTDRIDVESLSVRYLKIRFYSMRFTDRELWKEQERFLADAERLGVTNYSESRDISHLRDEWKINA